jgi:hypothetical protein
MQPTPTHYTHGRPTEDQVELAERTLRADYRHDVRDIVNDIRDAIKDGEVADENQLTEWIDQAVDGHERVIYTGQSLDTLRWTRDRDVGIAEWGLEPFVSNDGINWAALTYWALRADVVYELGDFADLFERIEQPRDR